MFQPQSQNFRDVLWVVNKMHINTMKVKVEFEIWKTLFEINYPVPSLEF